MIDNLLKARKKSTKYFGFIDEYGNFGYDFNNPSVSTHYIVSVVIVEDEKVEALEKEISAIRNRYFPKGEIKASKLSKSDKRRYTIVKKLCELDFTYLSLIVDKEKINLESGLRFKDSFTKYLNDVLYSELYTSFPKIELVADDIGNSEYMDKFREYVLDKHQPDMLEHYEFGFDNSKSNTIIQLSDVISGLLALKYDRHKMSSDFIKYQELLEKHEIARFFWPVEFDDYLVKFSKLNSGKYDDKILMQTMKLVDEYIKKYNKTDVLERREHVYTLKYLKQVLLTRDVHQYTYADELSNRLSYLMGYQIKNDHLRTQIIARLRDEGVIISSCHSGYKIPVNEEEIIDFVNQTNKMIAPMMARLDKCRKKIYLATNKELDILNYDEFKFLKKYLD